MLLVSDFKERRKSYKVETRYCSYDLPERSFIKLRDGLYVTSPELTFVRMGNRLSEAQLAAVGTDLCGRYHIDPQTGEIRTRTSYIASSASLRAYLDKVPGMCGAGKARRALQYVLDNSGSPMETKMALLFRMPARKGGLALPFDAMNYDVKAGRLASILEQSDYSIDLANTDKHFGLEYDGQDYHLDVSHDKRRRNSLAALGWTIYPIDKNVLFDAVETDKAAQQIAKIMDVRVRRPENWWRKYLNLRSELGLPA